MEKQIWLRTLILPVIVTIGQDLIWERFRNRISQGRFIATWAGILTSVAVNNLETLIKNIS